MDSSLGGIICIAIGVIMLVCGIIYAKRKYAKRSWEARRTDLFEDYDKRMEQLKKEQQQ